MDRPLNASRPSWLRQLPKVLFYVTFLVSILTTWHFVKYYLDSDASSEMVLAWHWLDTGKILSTDWIYGSELRILHVQLIYAPLLLIFDDWQTVRFLGAVIMQVIYLSSFGFLLRQAGVDKQRFYLGGTVLLLPVSVAYGRIVLYHNHYLPNITISFFLVGLVLSFVREQNWKSLWPWLRGGILLALSFLSSVSSIRQLMITHAPLLLALLVHWLLEDSREPEAKLSALLRPQRLRILLPACAGALAAFLGLLFGQALSARGYTFCVQPSDSTLAVLPAERWNMVLYGYFHQFGFREDVPLLSICGILSMGSLFLGVYVLLISLKRLRSPEEDIRKVVLYTFFLWYTGIMLLVFIITGNANYYYPLYLTLCLPWAAPVLLEDFAEKRKAKYYLTRLFSLCAVALLVVNGLVNIGYLCGVSAFDQPYEGLTLDVRDHKQALSGFIDYAQENGYDLGYGLHWECNIVTEMTNGEMPMVNIYCDKGNGNIAYYDCLTSRWLREKPAQKPFLLLDIYFQAPFEGSDSAEYCTLIYQDDRYCFYSIDDIDAFISLLYS